MPHPDTFPRLACCLWLTALDSGLTAAQTAWLRQRLTSRVPFTAAERARVGPALRAWCARQGITQVARLWPDAHQGHPGEAP